MRFDSDDIKHALAGLAAFIVVVLVATYCFLAGQANGEKHLQLTTTCIEKGFEGWDSEEQECAG